MMRKKWKYFLISAALLAIIFVSIERYDNYIGQKFYQESTQGLLATYEQLDKTFMMFAQRNWNALEDWCNYLNYRAEEQDKKEQNAEDGWGNFVNERKIGSTVIFMFLMKIVSSGLLMDEEERQST